ncbi:MAG: DUF2116 family Zn-ribbon domain-containing protein [Methanomassiliicoccaceae archaeon]|jgi:predicted nucleic acid-binding Zn ribbon protein|nr:DUF2116 family Zn-ribbon domain-containing protein [Methanomassiliicoccaceae archaeon]
MKCPKCQHDNPPETIFCEECDHRLDQPYREKRTAPVIFFVLAAVVLGVLAVVAYYLETAWFIPMASGGVGLFLGGYSMSLARISGAANANMLMVLAGAGMAASAVGFMLGITLF